MAKPKESVSGIRVLRGRKVVIGRASVRGRASSGAPAARPKDSSRHLFAELNRSVQALEGSIVLAQEALVIISKLAGQAGRRFRGEIVGIMQRWPDDFFWRLHFAGKL